MQNEPNSRYGRTDRDAGKNTDCHVLDIDLSSSRKVESLSDSGSLGGSTVRETYTNANVSTAMIELTTSTK